MRERGPRLAWLWGHNSDFLLRDVARCKNHESCQACTKCNGDGLNTSLCSQGLQAQNTTLQISVCQIKIDDVDVCCMSAKIITHLEMRFVFVAFLFCGVPTC